MQCAPGGKGIGKVEQDLRTILLYITFQGNYRGDPNE